MTPRTFSGVLPDGTEAALTLHVDGYADLALKAPGESTFGPASELSEETS